MTATPLDFIKYTERMVGAGHPTLADTLNRALLQVLAGAGIDDTSDFTGLVTCYSPYAYGAVGDGAADDTAAFQACADAAIAAGGEIVLMPGRFKCGLITDTSAKRLQVRGMPGAVIVPSGPTWWKSTAPSGGKFGFRMDGVVFSLANTADMTPVIWLEGSSAGGIVDLDIHDIDFGDCTNLHGDMLWLRACFSGSVGRLWAESASGMKGIVYTALNYNSGNIRFYDLTIDNVGVALQLGRAYDAATNQQLLNQIECENLKFVRSAESLGMYNPVTLTAGGSVGDTTLTVSAGDATAIANALGAGTPQFAVCADPTLFGDVIRVTSASGTTVHLAAALPTPIANGTIVAVGTMGAVVGANSRGVMFRTLHCESLGFGVVVSGGNTVTIDNGLAPSTGLTYPSSFVYQTNGAQNVKVLRPIYSAAATHLTLSEVVIQGTITDCDLVEPTPFSAGAGPSAFMAFTGTQVIANRNKFLRRTFGGATQVVTYGATVTPDESYDLCVLTVTDGSAYAVALPLNRCTGRRLLLDIYNNSGGAMGAVTFNGAYKLAGAFTAPANGQHRLYEFVDGFINGNLREISRSVADIAN